MGSQMIQIIILAGIALFLILRLRNVLGTRQGYEKPQGAPTTVPGPPQRPVVRRDRGRLGRPRHRRREQSGRPDRPSARRHEESRSQLTVADFAHGARAAYEMIVMAYENGDLETLRQHLSPEVFAPFAEAIEARAEPRVTPSRPASPGSARSSSPRRASRPTTNEADITMRFVGELTSVVRDPEGRIVEGAPNELKQQKDVWTFTRDMTSDNPNWQLTGTGS